MNPNDDMEQFTRALGGQPAPVQAATPTQPVGGGALPGLGQSQSGPQTAQASPDSYRPAMPQSAPMNPVPVPAQRQPVPLQSAIAAFRQNTPAPQGPGTYAQPTPPIRQMPVMNGIGNNPNGNPQSARLAQLIENWRRMRGGY